MHLNVRELFLVAALALAVIGSTACAPNDDPAPPPVPDPPEETDYSQPGTHGKIGISTSQEDQTIIDVDTEDTEGHGGVPGTSPSDRKRWDSTQKFEECPEDSIYVCGATSLDSVPQCADGVGFAPVCQSSAKKAWDRATNVVRSCERVPSCRGRVAQSGQEWNCFELQKFLGVDGNGNDIFGNPTWEKDCWTQYKVVCFEM